MRKDGVSSRLIIVIRTSARAERLPATLAEVLTACPTTPDTRHLASLPGSPPQSPICLETIPRLPKVRTSVFPPLIRISLTPLEPGSKSKKNKKKGAKAKEAAQKADHEQQEALQNQGDISEVCKEPLLAIATVAEAHRTTLMNQVIQ